jgi:hypothetical protein
VALVIYAGSYVSMNLSGVRGVIEEQTWGFAFQGLILGVIDLLPAYLMVWTLVPIWATAVTIIYFERRTRREGYDIDVLATRV